MRQVLRTERLGDGVNVVWEKDGKETTTYVSFTRLIDMRVNALDILDNPRSYGFDEKTGEVGFVAFCQPSWHRELQE